MSVDFKDKGRKRETRRETERHLERDREALGKRRLTVDFKDKGRKGKPLSATSQSERKREKHAI